MIFTTVISEGSLISVDLISEITAGTAPGQKPEEFGLRDKIELNNEIAACWSASRDFWAALQSARKKVKPTESGASETRDFWVLPLLKWLGFENISFCRSATVIGSRTYAISHREGSTEDGIPIHIEGVNTDLDKRPESGRPRIAPHSLVQEYLNRSENLWGIVSNGRRLRIIRDSARLSRPSYLEFDLEQMMIGERFVEFQLLFRILHRSRWQRDGQTEHECLLERYYQDSIESGGRVREKLREGVETAVRTVGDGFLKHPLNEALRNSVTNGELEAANYYRQILRLIYRWLFLMVSEERNLVGPDPENDRMRKIYERHYSIGRLRQRVERPLNAQDRHWDLWEGIKQTFRLYQDSEYAENLQVAPLNGDLFGKEAMPHLMEAYLSNADLLRAFQKLSLFQENHTIRRINYAHLDVEELGSVYESLLDYHPLINKNGDDDLSFELAAGSDRKTTGSYYTRPELVAELIKSGLEPVMEERLSYVRGVNEQEDALLSLKICDPAAGSGHFLLAAARRVGRELAKIRLGEEHPTLNQTRLAVRDVIRRCIYGVDLNPLAVDLCKVALWLEGHNRGMPLTFLDHRVKCGNSLIGIDKLERIAAGIPDGAYGPVTGDDRTVARHFKTLNGRERNDTMQAGLGFTSSLTVRFSTDMNDFNQKNYELANIPELTSDDVNRKQQTYQKLRNSDKWNTDWIAAGMWTSAFFYPLTNTSDRAVATTSQISGFMATPNDSAPVVKESVKLAQKMRFFHWPLEFPEVFSAGGFDVVLGNPPWERIKLQEQEFFQIRDPEIAQAANKAAREKLIKQLPTKNPDLAQEFAEAKHLAESSSRFVRSAGRFEFTAVGDVNTYALFAELSRDLVNKNGRSAIIVPTGIATDDTCKKFFGNLNNNNSLVSLFDFENREKLFAAVDSRYKFSLFTTSGKQTPQTQFAFFLTRTEHLDEDIRRFNLSPEDLALINPNTLTTPVFRTKPDAELTRRIYQRVPVLVNERTGVNPWGIKFATMFHMSNDSHLFHNEPGSGRVPLYEGKMVQAYDHRAASVITNTDNAMRQAQPSPTLRDQHRDPFYFTEPRYWVQREQVEKRLLDKISHWLLAFKDVTSPTNERTAIGSFLPTVGVGHKLPLIFFGDNINSSQVACFSANFNSLVYDFIVRQKLGGISLTYFVIKQIPVIPPGDYSEQNVQVVSRRVIELSYTSYDMEPFARDCGYDGPPFVWDEDRRALLRAELDAYYAKLYGLDRDELRYILDPQDIYGHDFPGETFRVLKEKEIRRYGEYRTRRLVLEAWDRLFGK